MQKNNMDKLFDDTLMVKNERPTELTPQQKEELYGKLAVDMIKEQHVNDHFDVEEIAQDLADLYLGYSGFEMAKYLQNNGSCDYEFNGDLVDFLDNIQYEVHSVLNETVKLWVKSHGITPKLEQGTALRINETLNIKLKKGEEVYITGIRLEEGIYLLSQDKNKQGGYLITYEKVEANCTIIE